MENIYQTAIELNVVKWWTKRLRGIKQGSIITLESGSFNLALYNEIKEAKKPKAK